MQNVRLRSGPMLNAQEINLRYLNLLPNDRLLYNFRVNAGLPTSAQPLGGWENPKRELRGHFTGGHYLSACALRSHDLKTARRRASKISKTLAFVSFFPFTRPKFSGLKLWRTYTLLYTLS
ncbi:MAG: beta-L-arabinofuranosidase domain-containing protein [Acidobacteriaceae bacterium]